MSLPTHAAPRLRDWIVGKADEQILRGLLAMLIVATIAVLALDISSSLETTAALPLELSDRPAASPADASPAGPMVVPIQPPEPQTTVPTRHADGVMAKPMAFDLVAGGRLKATGTITPGAAERFAAEVKARGEYIKTVVLDSPGGSVSDALAMGRLIRQRGFATEVEASKTCVSSCPLVFVGGAKRTAGAKAVLGVHQVFAADRRASALVDTMSEAQRISARCQQYLSDMGVDLRMWVRAMETPKDRLYIFSAAELKELNVVKGDLPADTPTTAASGSVRPR